MTNVAEILKDCPRGMELDCTMYDNLYFDRVDEFGAIKCYIKHESKGDFVTYVAFYGNGCYNTITNAKCVIFPKGKTTWDGFISPCKFKDGDILYLKTIREYECIFINKIVKESPLSEPKYYKYANFNTDSLLIDDSPITYKKDVKEIRLATEGEKQKLFDAIKVNGYEWNTETKTLNKSINPVLKVGDIITTTESVTGVIHAINKNMYLITLDNQLETEVFYEDCQLATTEEEKGWMNYLEKIGYIWDKEKNILKPLPEELPIFIEGDRIQFENGQVVKIRNISNGKYIFDNIKPMRISYVNKHCKLKLFNIFDLKSFDKVIVRNTGLFDDEWCIDFFSHYKNNKYIGTGNCTYDQCVPYNKETKYLIGTSQEYRGYYKTW